MESMLIEVSRRIAEVQVEERHFNEAIRAFARAGGALEAPALRAESVMLGAKAIAHLEALARIVGTNRVFGEVLDASVCLDVRGWVVDVFGFDQNAPEIATPLLERERRLYS